jgi:thioredoxin 1
MPKNLVKNVTDASFRKDVINAPQYVAVVFGASWCEDCLKQTDLVGIGPLPDVKVVHVDVDHNPKTVKKFDIRGIPLVMLFEGHGNTDPIATRAKGMNSGELLKFIQENTK